MPVPDNVRPPDAPPPKKREGPTGFELLEEAYQLMRRTPPAAWIAYGIGTFPFLLGFLFFWSAMSRSAFAYQWVSAGALGLALLYIWMKCWQTVFAGQVRHVLTGETAERGWTPRNILALVRLQAFWQSTAWIGLSLSALVTIPLPAVFSFYQNLVVLPFPEKELDLPSLRRRAWAEACRWQGKTAQALSVISAIWLFLFFNLWGCFFFIPYLLKAFLGIETPFSRDPFAMLHSSVLAFSAVGAVVLLDPLVKILFLLKGHYGESLTTGLDLRVRLRSFFRLPARSGRLGAALVLALLFCPVPNRVHARDADPPAVDPAVESRRLDQAIEQTLRQPRFSWRVPRDSDFEPPEIPFLENFRKWLEDFFQWQRDLEEETIPDPAEQSLGFRADWLFYALIALLAVVLLIWILQTVRKSRAGPIQAADAIPAPEPVDLEDEDLTPDRLNENEWIRMGMELREQGEYRLALRAFFLGQLALLNAKGHVRLGRHKSNRDYLGEVRLREGAHPGLLDLFCGNMITYEAGWYGNHPIDEPTVGRFVEQLETMERVA